jgi:hypothetical protein
LATLAAEISRRRLWALRPEAAISKTELIGVILAIPVQVIIEI